MDNKFKSRKFIVTISSLFGAFALASQGLMNGDVALVISICVGAYNYVQGKIDERKA